MAREKSVLRSTATRRRFLGGAAAGVVASALDSRVLDAWAAEVDDRADFPIVVIGAGIGGLTAAAYAAKNGFPTTVIELGDRPGGYAVSFEREGFTFEVTPHFGLALQPYLEELGLKDRIELVQPRGGVHIVGHEFDIRLPVNDPPGLQRLLAERFPWQADRFPGFLSELGQLIREYRTPVLDPSTVEATHPVMTRLAGETAERYLSRHFTDPMLKDVLVSLGYMWGMPPSELTGTNMAVGIAGSLLTAGRQFVRHSPHSLAEVLAQSVRDHGGKVVLGTEVTGITVGDGAVTGVTLQGGRTAAARAVISNANGPDTFEKLLPHDSLPPDYRARLRTFRHSTSTFCVWLGLRESLAGRIGGYGHSVLPDGVDWNKSYAAVRAGDVSRHGFGVYTYDNVEPRYAPPGKGMANIVMMCDHAPWQRFAADYVAGRKAAYRAEKERVANLLIDRVEAQLIPGLRSLIEVQEASTPLTNWRYTKNPGGAIHGYQCTLDNCGRTRLRNKTPIKGLYLASAWGDPGGGINPVMRGAQGAFRTLMTDRRA
jgi:prolycopene isomerase